MELTMSYEEDRDTVEATDANVGQGVMAGCATAWILFFVQYWILIFATIGISSIYRHTDMKSGVDAIKAGQAAIEAGWAALGPYAARMQFIFYISPIVALLLAASVSGVLRVGRLTERMPWVRIVVFAVVFWIIDGSALFTGLMSPVLARDARQMWLDAMGSFVLLSHMFFAPLLSIIVTTAVLRGLSGHAQA